MNPDDLRRLNRVVSPEGIVRDEKGPRYHYHAQDGSHRQKGRLLEIVSYELYLLLAQREERSR